MCCGQLPPSTSLVLIVLVLSCNQFRLGQDHAPSTVSILVIPHHSDFSSSCILHFLLASLPPAAYFSSCWAYLPPAAFYYSLLYQAPPSSRVPPTWLAHLCMCMSKIPTKRNTSPNFAGVSQPPLPNAPPHPHHHSTLLILLQQGACRTATPSPPRYSHLHESLIHSLNK